MMMEMTRIICVLYGWQLRDQVRNKGHSHKVQGPGAYDQKPYLKASTVCLLRPNGMRCSYLNFHSR